MRWCPVFSLHLPPDLDGEAVAQAVKTAYRPLTRALLRRPQARGGVIVDAGTTERLRRDNHEEIVIALRTLMERAQLEPVGTSAYGAPLPLLRDDEALRQLARNAAINRTFFGLAYRPTGAAARSCSASPAFAQVAQRAGHRYLLCDTRALDAGGAPATAPDRRLRSPGGLTLLPADGELAQAISERTATRTATLRAAIDRAGDGVLCVLPVERLGDDAARLRRLAALFDDATLVCQTPSERIAALDRSGAAVEIREPDGGPWLLWHDPAHPVHRVQWRFIAHALELALRDPEGHPRARELLDRALCADYFTAALPPPLWDRARIEHGAALLLESALAAVSDEEEQAEARFYALEIRERALARERGFPPDGEATISEASARPHPREAASRPPAPAPPQAAPPGPAEAR